MTAEETPQRQWQTTIKPSFFGFIKNLLTQKRRPEKAVVLRTVAGIPINQSANCAEYESFQINTLFKIGQGTYGKVYQACRDGAHCGDYVAKVVRFNPDHLNEEQRNFLVEALMAKTAGDNGFGVPVQTFFFCDQGQSGVLIMRKFLPPGPITGPELLRLLKKIQIMHDNHILHTDLYHRNILRHPKTGDLYIIDFGLAFFLKEPVPESLRVTDVAGLLFGQPPDLVAGVADLNESVALETWNQYAETVRAGALQAGLNMKVNTEGTIDDPFAGQAPYKIDCHAYYDLIHEFLAPIFIKRLGQENIRSREVWVGPDICEP